jgi:uncharacterized membrane protein (UPF0127 family)
LLLITFSALYISYHSDWLSILEPQKRTSGNPGTSGDQVGNKVQIGDTQIMVDVANTPELRKQGLGGRASLDQNSGMLFVFDTPSKYRFWMKGMQFPIDFIYINDGKVVDIYKNAPVPPVNAADPDLPIYAPSVPITQLLEVNAGFADAHHIQVGDKVGIVQ